MAWNTTHGFHVLRTTTRLSRFQRDRHIAFLFARRQTIVFKSDRGGGQQVYVMSTGGMPEAHFVWRGVVYGTPVLVSAKATISPFQAKGPLFSRYGVMSSRRSPGERIHRRLSQQGAAWAPNGTLSDVFVMRRPGGATNFMTDVFEPAEFCCCTSTDAEGRVSIQIGPGAPFRSQLAPDPKVLH